MGNETSVREDARGVWIWPWLSALMQDRRYGARALRRSPGFSMIAIGTLALGVGASSAMFGVVDALLFRPPEGVRNPASVVRVRVEMPAQGGESGGEISDIVSYPDYADLRDNMRGFAGTAAFLRATLTVGEGGDARNELTILATGSYFPLLGATTTLGRTLGPEDDRENAALPVAVLSWQYWQRAFGGDRGVLGKIVRVGGRPFTIIGVAAKHFVGTELGATALWVPLGAAWQLGYDANLTKMRFAIWLSMIARLGPGLTHEQAVDAAKSTLVFSRNQGADFAVPGKTGASPRGPQVELSRLAAVPIGGGGGSSHGLPVSLWFVGITGIVLLIACANVANLLLARASQRSHELAVRASLGATRGRLVRQMMTESMLVATLGGVTGLGLALVGTALLPQVIMLPPLPPLLNGRLLAFTLWLTLATTVVFGLAPALRTARASLLARLGTTSRSGASGSATRSVLVVVQLAASVVLLVSAALFVRSLQRVKAIDPGFAVEQLVEASGDTRGAPLTREQSDAFWARALERVRKLSSVRCCVRWLLALRGGVPDAGVDP